MLKVFRSKTNLKVKLSPRVQVMGLQLVYEGVNNDLHKETLLRSMVWSFRYGFICIQQDERRRQFALNEFIVIKDTSVPPQSDAISLFMKAAESTDWIISQLLFYSDEPRIATLMKEQILNEVCSMFMMQWMRILMIIKCNFTSYPYLKLNHWRDRGSQTLIALFFVALHSYLIITVLISLFVQIIRWYAMESDAGKLIGMMTF